MAELGPINMLLHNFLTATSGSEAVFIVKRDGTIYTSILRSGYDEKEIGGLTSLIRYISDVIRIDFETGYFRTSVQQISTQGKGFIFQQINPDMVLITICENDNKRVLTAYSVYIANKVDRIMKGESVSTDVPKSEAEMKGKIKPTKTFIFKIVIIGDPSVGKTTTTIQFAHARFESEYKPTIGVSIVKNEYLFGENLVHFQIWDLAGQTGPSFWKEMRRIYYGGAQGALILYDVTRPATFQNVKNWVAELKELLPSKIPCILVANKIDLEDRKVTRVAGEEMAAELNMPYIEISAKTAENLEKAFSHLGDLLLADASKKIEK